MTQVLLEEVNPLGNVQAVVEADGRVCYFYLFGSEEIDFGMRSVWVRNLQPAPERVDVDAMREGEAPLNPKAFCAVPEACPLPERDQLRVCWLPEGDGAALFEGRELLAIIPPWSGKGGFHGYARDCRGQGVVAWEMPSEPALLLRFEEAAKFWSARETNLSAS
jgi:hypothetical protein